MKDLEIFCENFVKEYKPLLRYVRDKKRRPIGLLVAYLNKKGKLRIGWSKCKVKAGGEKVDAFNRKMALYIAAHRAIVKPVKKVKSIPHTVVKFLPGFLEHCRKHFKIKKTMPKGELSGYDS